MERAESAQRLRFSRRLKGITDSVSNLIVSMDGENQREAALLVVPSASLEVGCLSCRYASPVYFYSDRIEYDFMHPYQAKKVRHL